MAQTGTDGKRHSVSLSYAVDNFVHRIEDEKLSNRDDDKPRMERDGQGWPRMAMVAINSNPDPTV